MQTLAILGGAPVRQEPFVSWPPVTASGIQSVSDAVAAGIWGDVGGPLKLELERAFAEFHDAPYGIAVSNGTVSLEIALKALGIGSGDEVIVPAYTFLATATAVLAVSATPVFVDVLATTGAIDPEAVREAITPRTKAIIPVHFAGQPADMDALVQLAEEEGLAIIEDAAQAHGARWRDQAVGSMGDFGSFSFQGSKNMTAGEGGILTVTDEKLADRAWSLHHCGRVRGGKWYEHELNGGNHRLTELQAALLLDQMTFLEEFMDRRTRSAAILDEAFGAVEGINPLQVDPRVSRHAYHLYCFRYDRDAFGGLDRDVFIEAMRAEGIPVNSGYNMPVNRQPVFAQHNFDVAAVNLDESDPRFQYGGLHMPESERLCSEIVWLPQTVLLSDHSESVVEAATKIQSSAGALR